ncbi:MAG: hypothetical protein RIC55_30985 [Pirellulaceae bacterium]
MQSRCLRFVLPTLLIVVFAAKAQGESIWVEGEAARTQDVARNGWYDSVKKDVLSGGAWLSHFNDDRPGVAEYTIKAEQGGEYTLWVRANHLRSEISFRVGDGPWQPVDLSKDRRGAMNIAVDNKPDLRFISWVKAGRAKLAAGDNKFSWKFDSKLHHHGAIDCFCLTNDGWVPSGVQKPGEAPPAGPDTWFPVVFDVDPLSPESRTDVSRLVEAPAGQHGFLKRDGDHLRLEHAEKPIKFWGIGSDPGRMTPEQMRQAARWYRKHGVNLVRQHTVLGATGLLNARGQLDAERLDHYDRWFAALKEEGVYSVWSVIYPHHQPLLQAGDGYDKARFAELASLSEGGRRGGPLEVNDFINLDRELQDIALRYFTTLLEHKNPYTGLAYKDDPALAILEFQNESNLFFHTLNSLREGKPPIFAARMRRAFFEFVKQKYGDKSAVAKAWGGRWDRDDRWDEGELGLMVAFHWGAEGPMYEYKDQHRRAGDYLEFLAGIQRDYFARRQQEVRAAGFQGVTVTTAWKAGGPSASMPNLYCDTAADMIDRHNYFGGGDGGHRITEGKVVTTTHLDQPGRGLLSLGLFQMADRPFAVSEWSMLPPSPYKAEAAPLYAFYGMGLQGWDAVCHFNCSAAAMGDGWPNLSKYVSHTPHYMGQFPALAFAIHNGHLREGDVVAARRLSRDDVFSGRDVLGQALSGGGFDNKEFAGEPVTPPEALAVGRVTIAFGPTSSNRLEVEPFWNRETKTLSATTGELAWHYGAKRVEIRSEKTQGIIGFAGDAPVKLPGLTADVKTPFVSLLFTPLDDQPLAASRQILVTAMARDKQTGAEYNDDWSQLKTVGGPPLLMEPVEAVLKLEGDRPVEVTPLDLYGVPQQATIAIGADGSFAIDGTHRTYYYEIRR